MSKPTNSDTINAMAEALIAADNLHDAGVRFLQALQAYLGKQPEGDTEAAGLGVAGIGLEQALLMFETQRDTALDVASAYRGEPRPQASAPIDKSRLS